MFPSASPFLACFSLSSRHNRFLRSFKTDKVTNCSTPDNPVGGMSVSASPVRTSLLNKCRAMLAAPRSDEDYTNTVRSFEVLSITHASNVRVRFSLSPVSVKHGKKCHKLISSLWCSLLTPGQILLPISPTRPLAKALFQHQESVPLLVHLVSVQLPKYRHLVEAQILVLMHPVDLSISLDVPQPPTLSLPRLLNFFPQLVLSGSHRLKPFFCAVPQIQNVHRNNSPSELRREGSIPEAMPSTLL